MVQDPHMKDALQILRDGVLQDSTLGELPLIAMALFLVRIKGQGIAGLVLRRVWGKSPGDQGRGREEGSMLLGSSHCSHLTLGTGNHIAPSQEELEQPFCTNFC